MIDEHRYLSPPLTPPSCDVSDLPSMMIDIGRLRGSEFDAMADDGAWRAGVNLWLSSFHQVPAGSLKGSDEQLCKLAGLGRDLKTWAEVKAGALRGWMECSDGRLYHPVVAEVALEAFLSKLQQRIKSGKGNRTRWGVAFDEAAVRAEMSDAVGHLVRLNPKSAAIKGLVIEPAKPPEPAAEPPAIDGETPSDPSGMPQGMPLRSQDKVREGNIDSETTSLHENGPSDRNKEAWDSAKRLLRSRGNLTERRAGSFFGKLLNDYKLEARDLLPAIISAENAGTADPCSILTGAAKAIRQRRPDAPVPVEEWDDDRWSTAIRIYFEEGIWPKSAGRPPGEPGCKAPSRLLVKSVAPTAGAA